MDDFVKDVGMVCLCFCAIASGTDLGDSSSHTLQYAVRAGSSRNDTRTHLSQGDYGHDFRLCCLHEPERERIQYFENRGKLLPKSAHAVNCTESLVERLLEAGRVEMVIRLAKSVLSDGVCSQGDESTVKLDNLTIGRRGKFAAEIIDFRLDDGFEFDDFACREERA